MFCAAFFYPNSFLLLLFVVCDLATAAPDCRLGSAVCVGVSFGSGQVGRQNLLFDGINWSDLILTIVEPWKGEQFFTLWGIRGISDLKFLKLEIRGGFITTYEIFVDFVFNSLT